MSVFNGARYLRDSIESILNQTYGDLEFLIIDDGSTDSTHDILYDVAREDSRIEVITREHRGMARSLNRGILAARGEFVARHDADDVSLPERLEIQVRFLDDHPEVAMVGGFAEIIDGDDRSQGDLIFPTDPSEIRASASCALTFQHGSLLIRRESVLAIGGYRPEFELAEDIDLAARMTEQFVCTNIPMVLYCYRRHGENVTAVRRRELTQYMELSQMLKQERNLQQGDRLMPGYGVTTPFPRT
jgi:glycosyltransferase involved in cell wall biosynthesis